MLVHSHMKPLGDVEWNKVQLHVERNCDGTKSPLFQVTSSNFELITN